MREMTKTTDKQSARNSSKRQSSAPSSGNLIGDVYRAPLEPDRYDQLIESWDQLLTNLVVSQGGENSSVDSSVDSPVNSTVDSSHQDNLSDLAPHFDRGYEALIRIGRHHSTHQMIDCDPRPSLGLDVNGHITYLNNEARSRFGLVEGESLTGHLSESDSERLKGYFSLVQNLEVSRAPAETLNLLVASKNGQSDCLMACVAGNAHPQDEGTRVRLVSLHLDWDDAIGKWLQSSFKLSEAETDVLRSVVSGESLNDLAVSRNRSIETIRSQLKSLLRKTNLGSQIDLLKLFAGFDHLPEELKATARNKSASTSHSHFMRLPDGRQLQYDVFGPDTGDAVVFLHGMLEGAGSTTLAQNLLVEHNLKLICPWRPSFAGSDPHDCDSGELPEEFASDVRALLDHLKVESCPIIGHLAGALYAYAFAARYPLRVTGLVNVAGAVPIVSDQQIRMMSTRQRIIAFSGKYTPRLLPFILRAALAQIDAGGVDLLVDAMYKHSPADQRAVRRVEIAQSIYSGYLSSVAQGHTGFQRDGEQVLKNWGRFIDKTESKVELIHGQQDPTVKIETVREACRQYPKLKLTELDGFGQLVFYERPDLVLAMVARYIPQR